MEGERESQLIHNRYPVGVTDTYSFLLLKNWKCEVEK